jgi:hypothetical protein
MTDNAAQKAVEAYAGLPMMYVHLSLELARQVHGVDQRSKLSATKGRGPVSRPAPVREDVLLLMERIIKVIDGKTINVVMSAPWLQDTIIRLYDEARHLLRLGEYVQVMVLPCPSCDLRALVRALDAPVIRCEHCAHALDVTTYETLVEQRQGGQ